MRRPEGNPPKAFRYLCSGLHQDAAYLANGSLEQMAANCVEFVPENMRPELRAYLEKLLAKLTPAELNGVFNRAKTDITFRKKGSEAFMRAVLNILAR